MSDAGAKQERKWRDMTVDANLRDEWLANLNRMRALELRSICEGHVARVDPLSRNAHITAVVHESLQPFFHRHWDEMREPISGLLATCFSRDDARISVEATRELTLNPGSHVHAREALFIAATKRHARRRREIDEQTVLWLERTVAAFMALDEGLFALCERRGSGGPIGRRGNRSALRVKPRCAQRSSREITRVVLTSCAGRMTTPVSACKAWRRLSTVRTCGRVNGRPFTV